MDFEGSGFSRLGCVRFYFSSQIHTALGDYFIVGFRLYHGAGVCFYAGVLFLGFVLVVRLVFFGRAFGFSRLEDNLLVFPSWTRFVTSSTVLLLFTGNFIVERELLQNSRALSECALVSCFNSFVVNFRLERNSSLAHPCGIF